MQPSNIKNRCFEKKQKKVKQQKQKQKQNKSKQKTKTTKSAKIHRNVETTASRLPLKPQFIEKKIICTTLDILITGLYLYMPTLNKFEQTITEKDCAQYYPNI